MSSIETFRTDRLTAERLRADHLPDLCRMAQDPRVMATLGGVLPEEETRRRLQDGLDHWDRLGYGMYTLRDRADGRFAGRAGLWKVPVEGRDEVELAYSLVPEFWGRGLATEMGRAVLGVGFGPLGLREIVSFTLPTNRASRRVMEKLGFVFERDIVHADLPHVLYRLPVSAWRAGGGDS